ncbi:MAG: DUF1553 domain-containing protein [Acidobacteriota bacterium]
MPTKARGAQFAAAGLVCVALQTFFWICILASASSATPALDFNRDVRPILSDKCYKCHGADAAALGIPRLDSEATAKADRNGRRAIVAGKPAESEMVRRITATDEAQRMPPVYSDVTLSQQEIELLRTWIAQGAKWQTHWSFILPKRPPVPAVSNPSRVRNPIDAFVLQRLQRQGLRPSPQASREVLLRRVALDLTGLPPTPAEIDAFLQDRSPGAYEKIVDRLLASPRYGERMAYRWLEAARYADSNGYQYDGERGMWRWRDWVIDAFNTNKPFDQFTLEQIAGDMLPNATLDQTIATGFNRNHRINTEDGLIAEEYAVEYVVGRVETTSAVFLGLMFGCARCHNHKYDPFTQKEFYQFYAYFNNVPELGRGMKYGNSPPVVAAPLAQQQRAAKALDEQIARAQRFIEQKERAAADSRARWEQSLADQEPLFWAPSVAAEALAAKAIGDVGAAAGRIGKAWNLDGKSYLDGGPKAGAFDIDDRWTASAWIYADGVADGSLVSRMADNPKGRGYGVHINRGKVHVNVTNNWESDAIRVETEETLLPGRWHHVAVSYSGSRMAEGIRVYLDGKPAKLDVQQDNLYRPFRNAGKEFVQQFRIGAGWGPERRFRGRIDDLRLYGRILSSDELAALAMGSSVNAIAAKPAAERSDIEQEQLRWYFLEKEAPLDVREEWRRVLDLKREKERLEQSFPTVMVMAEAPVQKKTFLLNRGAYNKPGDEVGPGVPAVLPRLPAAAPNNRLGFARWLVSPENPLLARVTVNRFWQMYFGTGLVKTAEDFGAQGESPSHPALLDWLATEFVSSGWDLKALHKLIVTSATYRQASAATPELLQKDPENRLLARGPRFRLSAEVVRDQALYIAGLATERVGGPSVKPYQPAGLWDELSMQDMSYRQDHGPDLYRRSLYTFWKRTVAPPFMLTFDAASRESCVVRENRTNTPLQALNLMNDVTFVEAARALGQRMMREGGAEEARRLRHGFRLVTGRLPSAAEERIVTESLRYHRLYFAADPARARKFLSEGDLAVDKSFDAVELASYAAVGSLLLNLDETVSKQ